MREAKKCLNCKLNKVLAEYPVMNHATGQRSDLCEYCLRENGVDVDNLSADPAPAPAPIESPEDVILKKCRVCEANKPLKHYAKNKTCRDGHDGTCKKCMYGKVKAKRNNMNGAHATSAPKAQPPTAAPPRAEKPSIHFPTYDGGSLALSPAPTATIPLSRRVRILVDGPQTDEDRQIILEVFKAQTLKELEALES